MLKVEEFKENPELNQYHPGIIVSLMKLDPWNGSLVGTCIYSMYTVLISLHYKHPMQETSLLFYL